jgi:hypothetical protein
MLQAQNALLTTYLVDELLQTRTTTRSLAILEAAYFDRRLGGQECRCSAVGWLGREKSRDKSQESDGENQATTCWHDRFLFSQSLYSDDSKKICNVRFLFLDEGNIMFRSLPVLLRNYDQETRNGKIVIDRRKK